MLLIAYTLGICIFWSLKDEIMPLLFSSSFQERIASAINENSIVNSKEANYLRGILREQTRKLAMAPRRPVEPQRTKPETPRQKTNTKMMPTSSNNGDAEEVDSATNGFRDLTTHRPTTQQTTTLDYENEEITDYDSYEDIFGAVEEPEITTHPSFSSTEARVNSVTDGPAIYDGFDVAYTDPTLVTESSTSAPELTASQSVLSEPLTTQNYDFELDEENDEEPPSKLDQNLSKILSKIEGNSTSEMLDELLLLNADNVNHQVLDSALLALENLVESQKTTTTTTAIPMIPDYMDIDGAPMPVMPASPVDSQFTRYRSRGSKFDPRPRIKQLPTRPIESLRIQPVLSEYCSMVEDHLSKNLTLEQIDILQDLSIQELNQKVIQKDILIDIRDKQNKDETNMILDWLFHHPPEWLGPSFLNKTLYSYTFGQDAVSIRRRDRPPSINEKMKHVKRCQNFKMLRKYITKPLSTEEAEFPIAYIINVYHHFSQLEHLLRAIYHPQNYYCIHVDAKSDDIFKTAVENLASCFSNVILADSVAVYYESWERVTADMNCMKAFYEKDFNYRYSINLCGLDFPIKTNLEMVRDLKGLNGTNNLESINIDHIYGEHGKGSMYNMKLERLFVGWEVKADFWDSKIWSHS